MFALWCSFPLFNMTSLNYLLGCLSVTNRDWVHVVGHSPVFHILQIEICPSWLLLLVNSAGMLSTPAFFPIFSALTAASTSSCRIGWRSSSGICGQSSTVGFQSVSQLQRYEQYSVHLLRISSSSVRHFPDLSCMVLGLSCFSFVRSLTSWYAFLLLFFLMHATTPAIDPLSRSLLPSLCPDLSSVIYLKYLSPSISPLLFFRTSVHKISVVTQAEGFLFRYCLPRSSAAVSVTVLLTWVIMESKNGIFLYQRHATGTYKQHFMCLYEHWYSSRQFHAILVNRFLKVCDDIYIYVVRGYSKRVPGLKFRCWCGPAMAFSKLFG